MSSFERRSSQAGVERLLERGALFAEMRSVVDGSWPHRAAAIAIEGAPGLGKTALLNAISHWAGAAGVKVVRVRCTEEDRNEPMMLVYRLLSELPGGVEMLQRLDVRGRERSKQDGSSGRDHAASFADLAQVVECADERPILIAIDNLHLGDEQSLAFLAFLNRRLDSRRIHVIATMDSRRASGPLTGLDRLLVDHDTRALSLTPLSVAAATELVERHLGETLDPTVARVIWDVTGGNPFLLVGVARSLAVVNERSDPEGLLAALESVPSVVRWVLSRVAPLPPSAYALLEAIAVVGPSADLRLAAAAAAIEAGEAGRLADVLADLEVLRPGRPLEFVHPVVRSSIYADLPAERRWRLHEFVAQLLSAGGDVEAAASHLLRTEPRSNAWAATALVDAARSALAGCDVVAATCFAQRALAESAGHTTGDLLLVLADLAAMRGESVALQHLRGARDHGCDPVALATTGLRLVERLWDQPIRSAVVEELAMITPQALGANRHLVTELGMMNAVANSPRLRMDEGLPSEVGDRGRAGADDIDLRRLASIGNALGAAAELSGVTFDEFARTLGRSLTADLVSRSRSRWRCEVLLRGLTGIVRAGRPAEVDHFVQTLAASADDDGRELPLLEATILRAESLTLQGRLQDADDLLATTVREAPADGDQWHALALVARGVLGSLIGEPAGSDRDVPALFTGLDWRQLGPLNDFHAAEECGRLQLSAGRWSAALGEFARAADLAAAHGVVNPALTWWRLGRCRALVELGAAEIAADLARENLAMAREFGAPLAIARALRGAAWSASPVAAAPLLAEALEALDGTGLELDRCTTILDLGAALHRSGDVGGARQVLRDAADLAVRIGAGSLANAAFDHLRATGARPRRLPLRGVDALTVSERRVVDLAARGDTNSAIATALFVNMKTVESHLLRAYRKLGIRTRSELAVLLNTEGEQLGDVVR